MSAVTVWVVEGDDEPMPLTIHPAGEHPAGACGLAYVEECGGCCEACDDPCAACLPSWLCYLAIVPAPEGTD